jgi:transposase
MCESAVMAQTVCILLSAQDRAALEAIVADRRRPLKHILRARIILQSAERLPVLEIAERVGVSRPMVWRWQHRYGEEGIEGLLRDKTRPPGIAPIPQTKVHEVVERTLRPPPGIITHWTGRAMAKASGLSLRTVQRIWEAHKLQPHRVRSFKRSTDPDFAAKLDDIVGLYMDPPRHAVVFSIDEKSQIQALDRTQPGLPLKRGKCATMTHDYKRNGTTTLFAALDVLDGKVIGRCVPRHRHQEFIAFLGAIERAVPPGRVIHAITDNYATHKHPKTKQWLAAHPRWTMHFTPKSCSWLNAVETFFSKLTRQSLRRGVFRSVADLEKTITAYINAANRDPKPFVWTASAQTIKAKLGIEPTV